MDSPKAAQRLALAAATAAAVVWWNRRRRAQDAEYTYLRLDPSLRASSGKLVAIQRHGQAEKNVVLKADKTRLKGEVAAALERGEARGDAAIAAKMAEWDALCGEPRWYDDCLDATGVGQALAAGRELRAWCRRRGRTAPDACAVSPFRRALQTQELGWRAAGFDGAGVLGDRTPWVARDELRETPRGAASPETKAPRTATAQVS